VKWKKCINENAGNQSLEQQKFKDSFKSEQLNVIETQETHK